MLREPWLQRGRRPVAIVKHGFWVLFSCSGQSRSFVTKRWIDHTEDPRHQQGLASGSGYVRGSVACNDRFGSCAAGFLRRASLSFGSGGNWFVQVLSVCVCVRWCPCVQAGSWESPKSSQNAGGVSHPLGQSDRPKFGTSFYPREENPWSGVLRHYTPRLPQKIARDAAQTAVKPRELHRSTHTRTHTHTHQTRHMFPAWRQQGTYNPLGRTTGAYARESQLGEMEIKVFQTEKLIYMQPAGTAKRGWCTIGKHVRFLSRKDSLYLPGSTFSFACCRGPPSDVDRSKPCGANVGVSVRSPRRFPVHSRSCVGTPAFVTRYMHLLRTQ